MSDLTAAANKLGGKVVCGYIECPGPGHSKHDNSLHVWFDPDAPDGFRFKSWAADDRKACRDHVRDKLGVRDGEPPRFERTSPPAKRDTEEQSRFAVKLFNESRRARGTLVQRYLGNRGIELTDEVIRADAIRFEPRCCFKLVDGSKVWLPAMQALFRDIHTNKARALHSTALRADGSGRIKEGEIPGLALKKGKRMLGPVDGCAIKLCAEEEVLEGLGICEGIEDGLALIAAGWRPVWACGSKDALSDFPVLSGVECLTVFGDPGSPAEAACRKVEARWVSAGLECRVIVPAEEGDWNDVFRRLSDG
jgi:putative DNA primase/helicase